MIKIKKVVLAIFFLYLLNGVYLSQFDLNIVDKTLTNRIHPDGYYDYVGVLNVHTTKSTGSGTPQEVIHAAQKSGLDFIFINDSNDLKPDKELERYHDHLLVFVDSEVSHLDSRVLIYGKKNYSDFTSLGQVQALISDSLSNDEVNNPEGGLLVLAHPFKRGFGWQGDLPLGFNGIEIINLKSIWQNAWHNQTLSFFWSILTYPFNPELALVRMFPFPKRELGLWDQMNSKQQTLGFAGADADAKLKFPKDLNIPSYETLFNIVRTHVILNSELTGNSLEDSKKIKTALQRGNFYVSLDLMASPIGFNTFVTQNDELNKPMGSRLSLSPDLNLIVQLPTKPLYPIDIMIYRDGERVLSSNSLTTTYKIHEPGVYRVVVRIIPTLPLPDGKKWIPWIITNPFFVTPQQIR